MKNVELWHVMNNADGGYTVVRMSSEGLFAFDTNHDTRQPAEARSLELNLKDKETTWEVVMAPDETYHVLLIAKDGNIKQTDSLHDTEKQAEARIKELNLKGEK